MAAYLNKPYDLLEIKIFRIVFSFGIAIFCFMFLFIFEPFGLYKLSVFLKLKIISIYVLSGLIISVIHLFWLQKFIVKSYNLKNSILWISWIIFLISISCAIINNFTFNQGHIYFQSFILFIGIIFATTIIPVLFIILWHYGYTLKKQIKIAGQLNKFIQNKGMAPDDIQTITIEASNKRDNITLLLNNFLYIKSADNYIDVYYKEENLIKHNLLRNTLNEIEKKFEGNKNVQRCHISYIVNTGIIESILGNASGYKLKLRHTEKLIPISKKYREGFFKLLKSRVIK